MIEIIIIKGVQITPKPKSLRSYQAGQMTAGRAAELLIAKAEGEGYVDTIPNRAGLLAAKNGAGLRRLEEAVGLHGKEIRGVEVTLPGEPGESVQVDGQGLTPVPKKVDRLTKISKQTGDQDAR